MISIYLADTDEYIATFNSFSAYLDWNAKVCEFFTEHGYNDLIPHFIVRETDRMNVDPLDFAKEELAYRLEEQE